jgi:purine nucleosidase
MTAPVIIDTDPAVGIPLRDVDDALAILYLLARPGEFEVAGLTSVFGNAALAKTSAKARETLAAAGRKDVPVMRGAARAREMGVPTPASRLLIDAARQRPGELTVLAIGPLTNVATALVLDGGFAENVRRIVFMGGSIAAGIGIPFLSPFEFNFRKDYLAADTVLSADCEKVIISSDLCQQVVFGRRELEALEGMRSYEASYLARRIAPWLKLNNLMPVPWKGGFVPWDIIAAVYLRRPDLFAEEETCLRMRPARFQTGAIVRGQSCQVLASLPTPCRLPVKVDAGALLDEFLDSISEFDSLCG